MQFFERSSGVLVHPTSFPNQFGVGDFGPGAYEFLDYLEKAGQRLWQILPLGSTNFSNSPYQSFSSFAGNTILISPDLLAKDGLLSSSDFDNLPVFSEFIADFTSAKKLKTKLFKQAYLTFLSSASQAEKETFLAFKKENEDWLSDYCLFMSCKNYFYAARNKVDSEKEYLKFCTTYEFPSLLTEQQKKDYYYEAVWTTWPESLSKRTTPALIHWRNKLEKEIEYEKFLQYLFFKQWNLLKEYANKKNIQIIGDIPIFVAHDSADVWVWPENFTLNKNGYPTLVAGVPPDYFSKTGQLWGNPLYNWSYHKKEGYSWWLKRMKHLVKLVDYIRIDHFRGFDEYWAVKFGDVDARGGQWMPGPGKELFIKLSKDLGDLPIIAEDLGIITDSVTALRRSLGYPGMKILQFAFGSDNKNTYLPNNFTSTNAVVYTGTHDNDTSMGWYQNAHPSEQDHFRRYMNVSGDSPCWDMIRLAISSVAVFAIFPIQDIFCLGSEYRMNTPSTAEGNWLLRYPSRMLKTEDAQALCYLSVLFNRNQINTEKPSDPHS